MVENPNDYEICGARDKTQNSVIAITGARGFIGKHLIETALGRDDLSVRALVRNPTQIFKPHQNLTLVNGDLTKVETLSSFLLPGCTVVNLAYGFDLTSTDNICAAQNLLEICKKYQVKRFIHCSTASVFGRNPEELVSEESVCVPKTEYGFTKLAIERLLQDGARGHFEYINLRPTSVFGTGGLALSKLICSLSNDNISLNYLKSCLFNKRRLNLVSVETLVAAIFFIFDQNKEVDGQTFIVSQDDEPINNFEFVEKFLFLALYGKYYSLPPIKLPLMILSFILRFRGRDAYNPLRIYDSSKIRKAGFSPPRSLMSSLKDFVNWEIARRENL